MLPKCQVRRRFLCVANQHTKRCTASAAIPQARQGNGTKQPHQAEKCVSRETISAALRYFFSLFATFQQKEGEKEAQKYAKEGKSRRKKSKRVQMTHCQAKKCITTAKIMCLRPTTNKKRLGDALKQMLSMGFKGRKYVAQAKRDVS